VAEHRIVTDAVHDAGGLIAMQILHFGRYATHPGLVAPSALQAPISRYVPRELSTAEVGRTVDDFVRCARLARSAGYDGVEIMGSEGYLINQFIAQRTNTRTDEWGGSYENRMRFPVEIVRRVRAAVGADFLVVYRLSMLDLVPGGSTPDEVATLACAIEDAGASIINTGIGWHEARIPTIAARVPRGAFTWVTKRLMGVVSIPLVTSNRINNPADAEQAIADGMSDLVSLARPFLADPDFVVKAAEGRAEAINTCIACNQACLDHSFEHKLPSCLVNPRACREAEFQLVPAVVPKRIAVVGAGPAGLAVAATAARRGHRVTLLDSADRIGGQLNLAMQVPGKDEFRETLRYFQHELGSAGVDVRLGSGPAAADLADFDEVVLATGVRPRVPALPGVEGPNVVTYLDVLTQRADVGRAVAILGAGGIGFDVAEFVTAPELPAGGRDDFLATWGIDAGDSPGGLRSPQRHAPDRIVTILQRSPGKPGARLGKTTGWIVRAELAARGVTLLAGVEYRRVDLDGLHLTHEGRDQLLRVDTVVLCTGQEPNRDLYDELVRNGGSPHLVGGAEAAHELDAKRAIEQGTRLGARL